MKSVAVRLTLLIMLVAAAGAAGSYIWTSGARMRAARDTADRFAREAEGAARAALELRASQQAYVAEGQGEEFWTAKAAGVLTDVRGRVSALRGAATSPTAQEALDRAAAVLRDFETMDRRAREYARGGQRLLASDLIFSDGLEMTGALLASLDAARAAEVGAHQDAVTAGERMQALAAAASVAVALIVGVLLVPLPKPPAPGVVSAPAAAPSAFDAAPLPLSIDAALDFRPELTPPSARQPVPDPSRDTAALESVATLCTDLARVADTRSLPSILERTALLLDASGIVVWIADPDGRELSPVVAHGYSEQVLGRLGTIAHDADNATAAAFRTGAVQTVKADAISNGAIAAPLITSAGPVGVMAAEVRHDGEQQPVRLAAAAIVAAQLATLVGPPASRVPTKAEVV